MKDLANETLKLKENIRFGCENSIRTFQEENNVKIEKIEITVIDGNISRVKPTLKA